MVREDVVQAGGVSNAKRVIYAGGGTGGHIYPNLAIAQRVAANEEQAAALFIVSPREVDKKVMDATAFDYRTLAVRPFSSRPWHWPGFYLAFRKAKAEAIKLLREFKPYAVVATGGFISGPVVAAAGQLGIERILVNLDAAPGKANRWLAPKCEHVFSVYPSTQLPARTQQVALPIRLEAINQDSEAACREKLGLNPQKPVLLITGASQGAKSMNQMMIGLAKNDACLKAMAGWQLLHLTGQADEAEVREAYEQAGLNAQVMAFSHDMAAVWGAATLVISRSGAGSVAEIAANRKPAIFMPYPYHRDQHQKLNAQPLVKMGGAILVEDLIDANENTRSMEPKLLPLLENEQIRGQMQQVLDQNPPEDGADRLAKLIHNIR